MEDLIGRLVVDASAVWLAELRDEAAEFRRDNEGDEDLDVDGCPLLFKSATRLFFVKGVDPLAGGGVFFLPSTIDALLCDPGPLPLV